MYDPAEGEGSDIFQTAWHHITMFSLLVSDFPLTCMQSSRIMNHLTQSVHFLPRIRKILLQIHFCVVMDEFMTTQCYMCQLQVELFQPVGGPAKSSVSVVNCDGL
jgi:hypothetical protein